MSQKKEAEAILLPVPVFLLEMNSERLVDAMHALHDAGFKVTRVMGREDRYRIDDTKEMTV